MGGSSIGMHTVSCNYVLIMCVFAFLICFGWNRSLKPLTSLSRKRHNQHDKSFVWAEHALYTSAF